MMLEEYIRGTTTVHCLLYLSHSRNQSETSGRTKSCRRSDAHFRHETIAKQFNLKNVWIFSFPLVVNLSWERLKLAILEASDQMILHAMLFEPFAVCMVCSFPDANSYANAICAFVYAECVECF